MTESAKVDLVTTRALDSDYSIIGIHAGSAVGLLGLLLFINLLRVWIKLFSPFNIFKVYTLGKKILAKVYLLIHPTGVKVKNYSKKFRGSL